MINNLNEQFKRSKNIIIKKIDDRFLLEINRKSRFIQKDAINLIEKIDNSGVPRDHISISFKSDVCSKSIKRLEDYGFTILTKD